MPAGTAFTIVGISDGVATVSFPPAFYAGGRTVARLRQAQVVYTLTQFPTVSRVALQSAGEPVAAPVGRSDYADLLALIVVSDPVVGQRVSSPVTVAGTANVFEATVTLRLLDASGREIATRFTHRHLRQRLPGHLVGERAVPARTAPSAAPSRCTRCPRRTAPRQHVVNVPVTLVAGS